MAFTPQQISPIDLNPSAAVGINLPFSGNAVFRQNFQTAKAIKNNLINFFLTNPGEYYLNPTFGGGLRDFIFEQINEDNLDFLQEDIASKLVQFFPNIIINSLTVTGNDDFNNVNIELKYRVSNTNIGDTLNLSL